MLTYSGQISKLISYFKNPIQYSLPIGDEHIKLNQFINKNIKIDNRAKFYLRKGIR